MGSIARQFRLLDFDEFDLILAMDKSNYKDILAQSTKESDKDKVKLFCDYVSGDVEEVPDPYFGGAEGFEKVLDMVEEGCRAIIDRHFNT